jgi:tetratricopeptide (TPR) repeat protein
MWWPQARAAEFDLRPAIACFNRGDNLCTQKLLNEAQARNPQNGEIAYYLGRAAHRRQQWSVAVEQLQRAVQLQPANAEFHFRLGLSLSRYIETVGTFSKPGVADRIRESLSKAVELNPDFIDARDALMKYDLAAPLFLGGSLAKAREQAAEIAKRSAADGHIALAEIADSQHQTQTAIAEYQAAIAADGLSEHDARIALSELYQRAQRYDDAFEVLRPILLKNPGEMQANYEFGSTSLACTCQLEEGIAALRIASKQARTDDDDPLPATVHLRLGELYQKVDRPDEARSEFKTALQLDATLDEAREALRKSQ